MTRSVLRRNVVTCWCQSKSKWTDNIRCVLCSKQYHVECHRSLIDNKAAWRCYLCYSEDIKSLHANEVTRTSPASELPVIDRSTECSSYDVHIDPAAAISSLSKKQLAEGCRRSQKCKTKAKTRKRTDNKGKISVRIRKDFLSRESSISANITVRNPAVNSSTTTPSLLTDWIYIQKPNGKQNRVGNRKSSSSVIQQSSESSQGCVKIKHSLETPRQQNLGNDSELQSAAISSVNVANLTHVAPSIVYNRSDRTITSQETNIVVTARQEDGIPARMRIAQSNMNGTTEATAWNDFGQGLLYLQCEDGCDVHLNFKVNGHSFLKIPLRPERHNPPVVRFEFPSLIIAVPCSESVWTKHAFTFLQSELSSSLNSILYVMNRVWNSRNPIESSRDVQCPNNPMYTQEHLIKYIRYLQERPEFRAYCNAIQIAIRNQPTFEKNIF